MTEGGWFDAEAIEAERLDADMEQAALVAAGARYARRQRQSVRLRAAGDLAGAARACPHGGGYPLRSLAAQRSNDPAAGQEGVRCDGCGSRLSDFPFNGECTVLVPCEIHVRGGA